MKKKKDVRIGYGFDLSGLLKEVQAIDRKQGSKLKSLKKTKVFDPEKQFKLELKEAKFYIDKMIVAINGIKLDEYFSYTESGFPVYEKVSLKNDTFIINSKLDWNDEHKYDTDSLMFKCRFLTLLLLQLKDKLKKMVFNKFEASRSKLCSYERATIYLHDYLKDMYQLVMVMLNEDSSYSNIIIKNLLNTTYSQKDIDYITINKLLYDNIIGTREGIESDIPVVIKKKEKKYNEENFRIKELIEVSYLLCTNSTKVNKKLVKKSFKAFDSTKDSKALVKQLGNSISKYYKDDKESLPMMFKAFGYAQPLIDSRYRDAKDDFDLLVGVNALAYTNFILNNKTVRKQYIKKIALT